MYLIDDAIYSMSIEERKRFSSVAKDERINYTIDTAKSDLVLTMFSPTYSFNPLFHQLFIKLPTSCRGWGGDGIYQ